MVVKCPVCDHTEELSCDYRQEVCRMRWEFLMHVVQCGLIIDLPDDYYWLCLCGHQTSKVHANSEIMVHILNDEHNWPALLTRAAMESM